MSATATAQKSPVTFREVKGSEFIGRMVSLESGQKLVNNTGKEEYQPYSPVLLPAGNHYGDFTGNILSIVSRRTNKLMTGSEFHVEGHGNVMYFSTLEFVNNLVKGVKYLLTCGEPTGEYSKIKSVEKAD